MSFVQSDGQGAWGKIINKAFVGNQRIRAGKPRVVVKAGVPNETSCKVGTLCWDATNGDAYICTNQGAGTWVKINA